MYGLPNYMFYDPPWHTPTTTTPPPPTTIQPKKMEESSGTTNYDIVIVRTSTERATSARSSEPPNNGMWMKIDEFAKSINHTVKDIKFRLPPVFNASTHASTSTPRISSKSATTTIAPLSATFGTRTFIPILVSFVAFLSFVMIVVAVCKFFVHRSASKKRNGSEVLQTEEGYKLNTNTLEPSAPPPSAVLPCAPPPQYHEIEHNLPFTSAMNGEIRNGRKVDKSVIDLKLRSLSDAIAKDRNSIPLRPLLDHLVRPTYECENCSRQPFISRCSRSDRF